MPEVIPLADAMLIFYMFLGMAAVGGFGLIMMFILVLFTPTLQFLKAKMKKMPLLAVYRPDKKIDYTPADNFIPPLAIHKKYGGFIVDSNSVCSAMKGGVSILPVNSEIGITLDPNILGIIDAAKQNGIQNIEELEFIASMWIECECGYKGMCKYDIIEGQADNLRCPNFKGEVKHESTEEERPVYISPKHAATDSVPEQVQEHSTADRSTSEDPQL